MKEIILAEEAEYPLIFANSINGNGYTAYYFNENKELHEGNHAVIYPSEINNLGKVLEEIRQFYAKMDLKAAIYHPFGDEYYNYFNENNEIISAFGYEMTFEDDYKFLALLGENKIKRSNNLDIRLLDTWDDRVGNDIILPCGEVWELESTKKFSTGKNNLLFVGFIDEKAVIYSTIHKSLKYDCVRFDYILCSKAYRGKGYGSEMVSYIADYCREKGFRNCFQWAGPSENIVRRAGFCDVFTARSGRINVK